MTTILVAIYVASFFAWLLWDAESEKNYWRREAERYRQMWASHVFKEDDS